MKMMLRWDNYKFIYHTNGGKMNLFDMENDPEEFTDISAEHPELCLQCREAMAQYYQSYGFTEALNGDQLVSYDAQRHVPQGYLDQTPKWPETVVAADEN